MSSRKAATLVSVRAGGLDPNLVTVAKPGTGPRTVWSKTGSVPTPTRTTVVPALAARPLAHSSASTCAAGVHTATTAFWSGKSSDKPSTPITLAFHSRSQRRGFGPPLPGAPGLGAGAASALAPAWRQIAAQVALAESSREASAGAAAWAVRAAAKLHAGLRAAGDSAPEVAEDALPERLRRDRRRAGRDPRATRSCL